MSKSTKDIILLIVFFLFAVLIGISIGLSKLAYSKVNSNLLNGNPIIKKTSEFMTVEYKVLSLKKGKLYVQRVKTGELISLDDQKLIKKALIGEIKKGDIIRF